jgi:hypothetical protein
VGDEPEEQRFLVVEVVVDGGPADVRRGGDVGQRDGVEPALRHEGGQGGEQLVPRHLAVLVQALADDLGHADIIGTPRQVTGTADRRAGVRRRAASASGWR